MSMGASVILSSNAKGRRWLFDYLDFSGNTQNPNSTPSPAPAHSPRSAKRIMELVGVRGNLEARTSEYVAQLPARTPARRQAEHQTELLHRSGPHSSEVLANRADCWGPAWPTRQPISQETFGDARRFE